MAYYLNSFTNILLFIVGCVAVCIALVIPGADYSRIFVGDVTKDLSWGPGLFRGLLFFHGGLLIAISLAWERLTKNDLSAAAKLKDLNARFGWRNIVILLVISAVALGLRLINLNSDLWVDEVLTLVDFVRQPMGQILTSFPNQNQHMLYSVLARISFDLFGESPWALRIPAVLFGLAGIWALYLLTKRFLGNKEALFASALMAVSYHHIWFSQNARAYTGLLFFTLLATWLWFEALSDKKLYKWIAYSVSIVLGMWVHMTMAFVVAAHGIVYLIFLLWPSFGGENDPMFAQERKAGLRPIAAWLLSVTFTLQLYALSLPEFLRVGLHEESNDSLWTNPIWVITETLQSLSLGFAGFAIVLCGGAFVAFGWACLFRENRRAAIIIALAPVFAGGLMQVLGHNLFPRFFFFAMGFGILIAIKGALELPKALAGFIGKSKDFPNAAAYAGSVFVLLLIAASITTVPRNYALPKQDFTGAKSYVESHRRPGEKVVAVSLAGDMYGKYFAPDWSVADTAEELMRFNQSKTNVWLVYTLSPEIKAFHPQMWETIEKDYKVIKVFPGTLNGGEVFICRKRVDENRKAAEKENESGKGPYVASESVQN